MPPAALQQLLIFPYNGNGREAVDALGTQFEMVGFIDDTPNKQGIDRNGFRVMDRTALSTIPNAQVLAVPGGPGSFLQRSAVIGGLGLGMERFATVIHPTASVSRRARIGRNVLITAGVVITSNAVIGDHVCVLPNSVIHHDTTIGDWTLVGAGVTIAGGVEIGENCYIGSGSSIINDVRIGDRVLVGLGTNVIKPLPDCSKVVGNPGRVIGTVSG
jgi:sugar O-acyltransferase (sialic acid O-acetyltransferase NeuD family)